MGNPKNVNQRQSNFTAAFSLFLQHSALHDQYREIAEGIDNVRLKAWLVRQAEFHNHYRNEIQELFEGLPEVPVKLSEQGKHYLQDKENELIRAANQENRSKLLDLFSRAEQSLYEDYSNVLSLETLLSDIREDLERRQKQMLERMKKLQRLATIPSEQSLDAV